jgi:hypothetical protein
MAKRALHAEAIRLRKQGLPYSQIQKKLGVARSSLSLWLCSMPLSLEEINNLRANNPERILKFIETSKRKRAVVLDAALARAKKDIGKLTKRELFIGGFFLYWGEGTKQYNASTAIANTDPAVICAFIAWMKMLGVEKSDMRIRLHLYVDMDEDKEKVWWAQQTGFGIEKFNKTYIKQSKLADITYNGGGFGHGTCNILYSRKVLNDYVLEGIHHIRDSFCKGIPHAPIAQR